MRPRQSAESIEGVRDDMTKGRTRRSPTPAIRMGASLIAILMLGAGAANAQPANSPPTASSASAGVFAGKWYGHGRGMAISRAGLAEESVNDGCCDLVYKAHYRL